MRRMLAAIVATAVLAGVGAAQTSAMSRPPGSGGGQGHHHHHGGIWWQGPWGWYNPFLYGGYSYGYSPYTPSSTVSASQLMDAEARLEIAQSDRQRLIRRNRELSNQVEAQRSAESRSWAAAKKAEPPKRPYKLSDADWNRISGVIAWPTMFEGEDFSTARISVDEAFRRLAERGGGSFTAAEKADLKSTADQLQSTLAKRIREVSASQYLSALRFIEGIRDAAKYS